jgi:hypothetical protein
MNCFVKLSFIVSNGADTTKPRISNLTAMLTNGLSWQNQESPHLASSRPQYVCTISSDNSENRLGFRMKIIALSTHCDCVSLVDGFFRFGSRLVIYIFFIPGFRFT